MYVKDMWVLELAHCTTIAATNRVSCLCVSGIYFEVTSSRTAFNTWCGVVLIRFSPFLLMRRRFTRARSPRVNGSEHRKYTSE